MRIVFYLNRFPGFGGIETVTEIIGCYLLNRGYEISIIAAAKQDRESVLMEHVDYYLLPNTKDLNSQENWERTDEILRENKFDAIIFQNSYAHNDELICTLASKYRIPLYIFEHNTPLYLKKIYAIKRWWHPLDVYRYLRYSRKVFENNAKTRKWHVDHCKKYILLSRKFVPEFIQYVGHGVDVSKIGYINNPIVYQPVDWGSIDKKENIILCVCQVEDTKRVDEMLKIWKKLHRPDWKFVIVGDGSRKTQLMDYVRESNVPNVEWHAACDPTPFYMRAKIFWMTSRFEGWGMTLVEGMQKGCVPVVYKSYSSVSDIIADGKNGYIVKNDDRKQFAKCTQKLMNKPELFTKMSSCAIEDVKRFDISEIGKQWEALLTE